MRDLRAGLVGLALSAWLAGCGAVSDPEPPAAPPDVQRVFVATRTLPGTAGARFGAARDRPVTYASVKVTLPPDRPPRRFDWLTRDAAREATRLSPPAPFAGPGAFAAAIDRAGGGAAPATLVFVHGFNTDTARAIAALARLRSDFRQSAPAVAFAWPSAGDPRAYAYDRDSVLFARDDLVDLLQALATGTRGDIAIIAHSMGGLLTMEALRQIALEDRRALARRIVWVALVSPDIDPDVFRAQARAIGRLPPEFYILTAEQDRALTLSSILAGGRRRLGSLAELGPLEGLDVTFLDFSAFAGAGVNHGLALRSPEAIAALIRLSTGLRPPGDNHAERVVVARE